jgi:ABC-2 type transport system ATP-binding protein
MRHPHALLALSLSAALLAGCGSSEGTSTLRTGTGGAGPAESRAGTIYDAVIQSPNAPDEKIHITVFEPRQVEKGKTAPLILEGHGYSGSRQTDEGGGGVGTAPIALIRDQGYGIISIDQRGHGDSNGTIRSMDPDFEGRNLVAILDWAEANLDWLAYGPDLDAGEVNPLIGAVGSSYGGGFQLLLHAIDPKKRLDVLVPEITWHDLTYSLAPGGVLKSGWVSVLSAAGETAGGGGNVDPFVQQTLQDGATTNRVSQHAHDFFLYHSPRYWCEGVPVATNGGPGTAPLLPPVHQTAVHALIFQGMRDTLFNFNEAALNYHCLKDLGGDVRLMSYQSGHNTLQAVPDPGQAYQPAGSTVASVCGSLAYEAAMLAFFAEHLKGEAGAIAAAEVPAGVCLSLAGADAIVLPDVPANTVTLTLPESVTVTGPPTDAPTIVPLGIVAGEAGEVFGGIPRLTAQLTNAVDATDTTSDAILFFGIGHKRATGPGAGVWDLMDNQLRPLRGLGAHDVDLVGVAERLLPGDEVALLIYGGHDQFHANGSSHPASHTAIPVSVTGTLALPLLGPLPQAP